MSTKTSFKRIAAVAAVALTLGGWEIDFGPYRRLENTLKNRMAPTEVGAIPYALKELSS